MLQSIRERTGIFLPVAVIGLLVVPFVISSLYGYVVGGGGPQTIATVDGVEITRSRLDQAYRERQSELRQLLGEQFDPSLFDTDQLRRETAQQLIDRAVLLNYARAQGLQATDADVAIAIRGQSIFQVDGSFSAERYRRILEQNRLTPERYESQLREDLTIDLLQRSIGQTAYTSDRELDRILALQRQRRELAWAVLPAEAYRDAVSIEESDLRAWYERNAERYRQPQQVQLRYLHLDLDAIAADIDIPRADIEARYAEREAEANADSLREIRHILIAVDESADTAAVEAARERAQSARQRIIEVKALQKLPPRSPMTPDPAPRVASSGCCSEPMSSRHLPMPPGHCPSGSSASLSARPLAGMSLRCSRCSPNHWHPSRRSRIRSVMRLPVSGRSACYSSVETRLIRWHSKTR